jgi:hypothetical protein
MDNKVRSCERIYIRGTKLQLISAFALGGKNTHTHGYPWVKSVTGMERVAKRVSTGIINGYLTTRYYMDTDTDLIVSIPTGTHTQ